MAGCAALWLFAAGDLGTLLQVVRGIVSSPAENAYAKLLGLGPWYRYLLDYLVLSPWPTLRTAVSTMRRFISCMGLWIPGVSNRTS